MSLYHAQGRSSGEPVGKTTTPAISRSDRYVLGRGMLDSIGTKLERALQHRSRPGVVDRRNRTGLASHRAHGGYVDDSDKRIGRRFNPDKARRGGSDGFP